MVNIPIVVAVIACAGALSAPLVTWRVFKHTQSGTRLTAEIEAETAKAMRLDAQAQTVFENLQTLYEKALEENKESARRLTVLEGQMAVIQNELAHERETARMAMASSEAQAQRAQLAEATVVRLTAALDECKKSKNNLKPQENKQ